MANANPVHSPFVVLSGVSCPSTTSCFAVGYSFANGIGKTLVEHWNGSRWSIMTSPTPGGDAELSGLSCPSATSCFADGQQTQDNISLMEHWNGSRWSIMTSPNPSIGFIYMGGVSCPNTRSCLAVGSSTGPGDYGATIPVAERWNGIRWSVIAAPIPAGLYEVATLNGVSCPSTNSCFAVGASGMLAFGGGSALKSLVEYWNGHILTIMTSPNPSGSTNAGLSGVSCRSATSCFAGGGYDSTTSTSASKTLVERYA